MIGTKCTYSELPFMKLQIPRIALQIGCGTDLSIGMHLAEERRTLPFGTL
jgi:hypothetical protein